MSAPVLSDQSAPGLLGLTFKMTPPCPGDSESPRPCVPWAGRPCFKWTGWVIILLSGVLGKCHTPFDIGEKKKVPTVFPFPLSPCSVPSDHRSRSTECSHRHPHSHHSLENVLLFFFRASSRMHVIRRGAIGQQTLGVKLAYLQKQSSQASGEIFSVVSPGTSSCASFSERESERVKERGRERRRRGESDTLWEAGWLGKAKNQLEVISVSSLELASWRNEICSQQLPLLLHKCCISWGPFEFSWKMWNSEHIEKHLVKDIIKTQKHLVKWKRKQYGSLCILYFCTLFVWVWYFATV